MNAESMLCLVTEGNFVCVPNLGSSLFICSSIWITQPLIHAFKSLRASSISSCSKALA